MAQPTPYNRQFNFQNYQSQSPTAPLPGDELDSELNAVKLTSDQTLVNLAKIQRDDGALKNGIVTQESLSPSLSIGFTFRGAWATATNYLVSDGASVGSIFYKAKLSHLSSGANQPPNAEFWDQVSDFTPLAIAADSVGTVALQDGSVTTPKIADLAVTTPKIADNAVTRSKLATDIYTIFIGAEMDCSGPFAPAGWLFKFGQAISRTTYSGLLSFLTASATGTTSLGSPTISSVSIDLRNLGLIGAPIEGAGIPSGATVTAISASTITLSANATATGATTVQIFPHGAGNGSTTFNLPDDRDRAAIGRGDMGGTAASRVTASGTGNPDIDTTKLGAAGGVDRHTLTAAQAPVLTGTAASNGAHTHTNTDSTAQTAVNVLTDPGGALILQGATAVDRTTSGNGAHTHDVTVNASGGAAHPNVQPSRTTNKIIFAGV